MPATPTTLRGPAAGIGVGIAVGIATGAVFYLLFAIGALANWFGLLLLVLLALALPTARNLSGRILLVGMLSFGWIVFAYWWPLGPISHGGLALAVVAASLFGWVFARSDPKTRARRLRPRIRWIDAVPLMVAAGGALLLRPWLTAHSELAVVSMALDGWDHVSHFDMVEMIRTHGVTIDQLPQAFDGTRWYFHGYPQAFHAGLATVMDFLAGPDVGSRPAELIGYAAGTALLLIAAAVMVAAGVCSLPRLRRQPWIGLPVAVLAAGAFLLGPGAAGPARGHTNFVVATALVAAVALAVIPRDRVLRPLPLAAIGGATVGLANGWLVLLVLVAPAVAVILVPFRRDRWTADRRQLILAVLIAVATLVGVAKAVIIVSTAVSADHMFATGGVDHTALPAFGAVQVTCIIVSLLLFAVIRRSPPSPANDRDRRTAWLIGIPVTALGAGAAIAAMQLRAVGELRYYFYKFVIAGQLVSIVVLAVTAGTVASLAIARRQSATYRRAGLTLVVGSLLATLAATQAFGYTGPVPDENLNKYRSPGLRTADFAGEMAARPSQQAKLIITLADLQARYPDRDVVYLWTYEDGIDPAKAEFWQLALAGRWTRGGKKIEQTLKRAARDDAPDAVIAQVLLAKHPNVIIAVPRDQWPKLRTELGDDALESRLVPFDPPR